MNLCDSNFTYLSNLSLWSRFLAQENPNTINYCRAAKEKNKAAKDKKKAAAAPHAKPAKAAAKSKASRPQQKAAPRVGGKR